MSHSSISGWAISVAWVVAKTAKRATRTMKIFMLEIKSHVLGVSDGLGPGGR